MLFGEGGSRVLISLSSKKLEDFHIFLKKINKELSFEIPLNFIGTVSQDKKLSIFRNKSN